MIKNQVIKVSKEKYLEKLSKENEGFIAKIELGREKETNVNNLKKIFKEVGNKYYNNISCDEDNYNAILDYIRDLSSLKSEEYQSVEIYIYNENNLDKEFINTLEISAKDHEYNVAINSNGYQVIMSFDIYILDTKISE